MHDKPFAAGTKMQLQDYFWGGFVFGGVYNNIKLFSKKFLFIFLKIYFFYCIPNIQKTSPPQKTLTAKAGKKMNITYNLIKTKKAIISDCLFCVLTIKNLNYLWIAKIKQI